MISILFPEFPTVCLVGRRTSSVLTTALARILTVTLLAGFLPCVKADCWEDSDGFKTCDGLSNTARIVIGVVIAVVVVVIILGLSVYRKRRINRQANLAFIQPTQQESGGAYGPGGGPTPFGLQPPPPAHNDVNYPYTYDSTTGFAPSPGPPPQYYPPPPGVPPTTSRQK